jgi:hypothetical protein
MASIPEKVHYYRRQKSKYYSNILNKEIEIFNTFPSCHADDASAIYWASQNSIFEEILNEPFEIKIIGLESRDQGGRAYKVIDSKNRMFDLREDQVIEIISTCGILPGGEIKNKFIWVLPCNKMKLSMMNGILYNEVKKESKRTSKPPIKKSELVIGKTYRTRNKEKYIYLGIVELTAFDLAQCWTRIWFDNSVGSILYFIENKKVIECLDDKAISIEEIEEIKNNVSHYIFSTPIPWLGGDRATKEFDIKKYPELVKNIKWL